MSPSVAPRVSPGAGAIRPSLPSVPRSASALALRIVLPSESRFSAGQHAAPRTKKRRPGPELQPLSTRVSRLTPRYSRILPETLWTGGLACVPQEPKASPNRPSSFPLRHLQDAHLEPRYFSHSSLDWPGPPLLPFEPPLHSPVLPAASPDSWASLPFGPRRAILLDAYSRVSQEKTDQGGQHGPCLDVPTGESSYPHGGEELRPDHARPSRVGAF